MAATEQLPRREVDFSGWYNSVVERAQLADYGAVGGTMVIRPYGYALWENVVNALDKEIKAAGVENAYFPLFIPKEFLEREEQHIEGFAPHVAWVTIGGGKTLDQPIAVRPTSETIMYPYYRKWVHSHRDLPVLINQWNNVVRWEQRTTLFLRTMEFLWQEGHTAHASHEESWNEVTRALRMYERVYRDFLAIPGYAGRKSESEKFAGADATTTLEFLMPDGRALQGCTSHDLGQNFAKTFDIAFQDIDGQRKYVWQTSWGLTTRSIGALIMVHGDNKGLRLPPKIAPIQAVIVPIYKENQGDNALVRANSMDLEKYLRDELKVRAKFDNREGETPGYKYNKWELRGVPLRIEMGIREAKGIQFTIVRRDTGERFQIPKRELNNAVPALLKEIQKGMLAKAQSFLADNTHRVTSYGEFRKVMETTRGMISALWCEDAGCEAQIKEQTKASTRCLPFDAKEESGICVHCDRPATHRWIFAQSY